MQTKFASIFFFEYIYLYQDALLIEIEIEIELILTFSRLQSFLRAYMCYAHSN